MDLQKTEQKITCDNPSDETEVVSSKPEKCSFSKSEEVPNDLLSESLNVQAQFRTESDSHLESSSTNVDKEADIQESIKIDRVPTGSSIFFQEKKTTDKNVETKESSFENIFDEIANQDVQKVERNETRRAPSIASYGGDTESEWDLSDADSDLSEFLLESGAGSDSDAEFDRFVHKSYKYLKKIHNSEYPDGHSSSKRSRPTPKQPKTENVREYEHLPPLEKLTIQCEEKVDIVSFGTVSKIVDCLVIIEPNCTEVLDFDSYLFDEDKKIVGQVFDIFGQVKDPQYAIRFNTAEEASIIPIGLKIFYAPNVDSFSKTPYKGLNLRNIDQLMMNWKRPTNSRKVQPLDPKKPEQREKEIGREIEFLLLARRHLLVKKAILVSIIKEEMNTIISKGVGILIDPENGIGTTDRRKIECIVGISMERLPTTFQSPQPQQNHPKNNQKLPKPPPIRMQSTAVMVALPEGLASRYFLGLS
ncbi:unnamed protein product [Caenorhabditis auriculariae]|uniref:H/ACA ribonucleoprotein complex non-core subunit NAF1 n=1 Tax=Caenorhabditis auriculariae TaxID=2777116 RepID=A0A8S1HUZ1_9PELO|nr:unnamed protein product [Caenorhabditis auriculariae]